MKILQECERDVQWIILIIGTKDIFIISECDPILGVHLFQAAVYTVSLYWSWYVFKLKEQTITISAADIQRNETDGEIPVHKHIHKCKWRIWLNAITAISCFGQDNTFASIEVLAANGMDIKYINAYSVYSVHCTRYSTQWCVSFTLIFFHHFFACSLALPLSINSCMQWMRVFLNTRPCGMLKTLKPIM